ncbi:MAG: YbhB/YbcL family Raf kinase inhibitor-like protein [Acidobacteriaceae bacterium]
MPLRRTLRLGRTALFLTLIALASNSRAPAQEDFPPLHLTSSSFSGAIPDRYASCSGQTGNSPALAWSAPPAATRSFALVVTDPDAPMGTFTHWLLWNLPAETRALPESVPTDPELASGARQGRNDFGKVGYGGPCPPGHAAHRYVFDLYALDGTLGLAAGASKQQIVAAIRGHIVATGELVGRYQR